MKVYCFTIEHNINGRRTQKDVYVAGYSEHDARIKLKRAKHKSRGIAKKLNGDTFRIIGSGKEIGIFVQ